MKKQLELFATPPEIPENLKALLCGSNENDFALGVSVAIGLGINPFLCLSFALSESWDLDIPDSAWWEHFSVAFQGHKFSIIEDDMDDFLLITKEANNKEEYSLKLGEWGENDDCFTMQKKLRAKIKQVLKDNYHYFKELLK